MTQVIFYSLHSNSIKLQKLSEIASLHFLKKEPLLFLVKDATSLEFIDNLLWGFPPESFLPHPNRYIEMSLQLLPQFSCVFNLQPSALSTTESIKTIYEFEDHSCIEKLQLSKQKYREYREKNLHIIVE